MTIKQSLSNTIHDSISDIMDAIGEKVKESEQAGLANLISWFMNIKYDDVGGVREFFINKVQV